MRIVKIIPFIFIFIYSYLFADTIDIQLTFDTDNVALGKEMGYDTIEYPGTIPMTDLGKPQLTMTNISVSLPFGSTVNSVSIVDSDTEDISGNFLIYPVQPPKETGDYTTEAVFTLPDPSIYNVDQFYPQNPYSSPFISKLNGATMGGIIVYPFKYNPVDRNLKLFTSLTLRLNYTPPSPAPSAVRYMEDRNKDLIIENVKSIVANPDDVEDNFEPIIEFSFSNSPPHEDYTLSAPDPTDIASKPTDMLFPYTYVIITNDRYCNEEPTNDTEGIPDACNPLSDWRTELGVPATLRTVEWIKANYWQGGTEDLQKAIRDFLTEAYQYWGTMWVILIGDVDNSKPFAGVIGWKYSNGYPGIVPARFLCSRNYGWVFDSNIVKKILDINNNTYYCPCDLYYMNVTDNFDKDGDELYGEPHDIDENFTYAIDIFGARVPVDKETEVTNFINKLQHYEKLDFVLPQTETYLSRCLQVGADFGNEEIKELTDNNYLPNFNVQNILEGRIDDPDNPSHRFPDYPEPWQVVDALDNPAGIINFACHGRYNGYLILSHLDVYPPYTIQWLSTYHKYTNFYVHGWNYDKALEDVNIAPKYSFIYSNACHINWYDWKYEGICGEEILFNPTWGGPLSVGNIRLGMLPVSFYIMKDFYIFLMNQSSDYGDDICYSGIVQCDTLKKYWPSGNTEYLEEMVYVNQLFGCSRTSIWRGDPEIFDVSTQVIQNLNNTYTLRVTVLNSSTSNPVESASVCLWMSNETPPKYYVELTNSSGIVEFNVGLGCANANLTTSFEKYNYKPDIKTITIP